MQEQYVWTSIVCDFRTKCLKTYKDYKMAAACYQTTWQQLLGVYQTWEHKPMGYLDFTWYMPSPIRLHSNHLEFIATNANCIGSAADIVVEFVGERSQMISSYMPSSVYYCGFVMCRSVEVSLVEWWSGNVWSSCDKWWQLEETSSFTGYSFFPKLSILGLQSHCLGHHAAVWKRILIQQLNISRLVATGCDHTSITTVEQRWWSMYPFSQVQQPEEPRILRCFEMCPDRDVHTVRRLGGY